MIVNGLAEGWIFDGENMGVYLEKDQTVEIFAYTETACKLWLAKEMSITKMEIISQDKTTTYVENEALNPRFTLKDVELKLTYEDGTTETVNGMDMYRYEYMPYYKGMPLQMEMVIDSTTATVFFTCADIQVEYDVKLDAATITGFEAIPAADMIDIYENTMGQMEDGIYVYYDAISLACSIASYKFTWSDGTVETFNIPMDGETEYHGVALNFGIGMDPIEDPWSVGVHSVPVTYGELSDTVDIEIKANNVASIEILDVGVTEYVLGDPDYFVNNEDGWYMTACDFNEFDLKVNYTDGTSKTFSEADIEDFRGYFAILNNTYIEAYPAHIPYTTTGSAKVYMAYMGAEDAFDVKLVEAKVDNGNLIVPEDVVDKALADKKNDTVTLNATTNTTSESQQTTSVKLPVASVEKLIEEEVEQVVVEMDSATVTLDNKTLEAIAEQTESASITLSIEPIKEEVLNNKQQAALADKEVDLVLSAQVLADGEPIGDFKGGSVKVQLPFEPESGYKYEVEYVADDGTTTPMTTEVGASYLAFWTNHFSDYVVTKEKEETKPIEPTPPEETTKPTEPTVPETTVPEPTVPETTVPEPTVPETTVPETTVPETTAPQETTKPTEATKPGNAAVPDTGDNSGVTGMMLVMLASGTVAAALWLSLRKRRAV